MTKTDYIMEKIAISSEILERAAKIAWKQGDKVRARKFFSAFEKRLNQELDALYGSNKLTGKDLQKAHRGSKIGGGTSYSDRADGIREWNSVGSTFRNRK
jgi:hypothetical protein